jgi:hypothetical protein
VASQKSMSARLAKRLRRTRRSLRAGILLCDTVGLHRGGHVRSRPRTMFTAFYTAPTWPGREDLRYRVDETPRASRPVSALQSQTPWQRRIAILLVEIAPLRTTHCLLVEQRCSQHGRVAGKAERNDPPLPPCAGMGFAFELP